MKRNSIFFAVLTVLFLLVGCGNQTEKPTDTTSSSKPVVLRPYFLTYEDSRVAAGSYATNVIKSLGKPLDYYKQAPLLAEHGDEDVYIYDGLEVTAGHLGKNRVVLSAIVSKPGIMTHEGVQVGDEEEKIKAVYGEPMADEDNMYSYQRDGSKMCFTVKSERISQIAFYAVKIEE